MDHWSKTHREAPRMEILQLYRKPPKNWLCGFETERKWQYKLLSMTEDHIILLEELLLLFVLRWQFDCIHIRGTWRNKRQQDETVILVHCTQSYMAQERKKPTYKFPKSKVRLLNYIFNSDTLLYWIVGYKNKSGRILKRKKSTLHLKKIGKRQAVEGWYCKDIQLRKQSL